MDYETGVASDPADLVAKLGVFAAANGWTFSTPASGNVLRKNTVVVGILAGATTVQLRGAITYNSGAAWDAQTNNSGVTVSIDVGAGPFTAYHFFTGPEGSSEYLHVAVEADAGHFRHFALGELVKIGAYTGGVYVDGITWDNSTDDQNFPDQPTHQVICDTVGTAIQTSHVWCDYDSKANNWQVVGSYNETADPDKMLGSARQRGLIQVFTAEGFQDWNLRNHMAPLHYFANRDDDLRSPIGRIPHMRLIGLQNLTPGETIDVGGDQWIVFPMVQRTEDFNNNPSSIESSGLYGYAYRLP